ncbi:hypothetical protein AM588_10002133 [Phytophthora nicotianae]|uniref:Vesicle transport protein n=1 Tax=Phytophthora nicotianae TaxID=4792 RepID=A0A0W8CZ20_PHYNI|nr:hypothetical protein AM588_10002133 [Phytophthora nicotianae]
MGAAAATVLAVGAYFLSGFLVGPKQQLKLMFKPVRRIATIIYLVMIAVVFTVALAAPRLGLVVLLLVLIHLVGLLSLIATYSFTSTNHSTFCRYSASYVPYGRKILTSIAQKICGSVG